MKSRVVQVWTVLSVVALAVIASQIFRAPPGATGGDASLFDTARPADTTTFDRSAYYRSDG